MIELRLEGLHYEIGLSIGEKCRNSVSSCCSEKCSKDKLDFAYECQRSVEKHWPDLLEELQEIYEGELRELTTRWAWIASLEEDKVYLCGGSPCKNEYKEYFLS